MPPTPYLIMIVLGSLLGEELGSLLNIIYNAPPPCSEVFTSELTSLPGAELTNNDLSAPTKIDESCSCEPDPRIARKKYICFCLFVLMIGVGFTIGSSTPD